MFVLLSRLMFLFLVFKAIRHMWFNNWFKLTKSGFFYYYLNIIFCLRLHFSFDTLLPPRDGNWNCCASLYLLECQIFRPWGCESVLHVMHLFNPNLFSIFCFKCLRLRNTVQMGLEEDITTLNGFVSLSLSLSKWSPSAVQWRSAAVQPDC